MKKVYKVIKTSYTQDGAELGLPIEYFFISRRKANRFVIDYVESYCYQVKMTKTEFNTKIDYLSPIGEDYISTRFETSSVTVA